MDEAYRQHSHHGRKNRSTTHLSHLTLAPLVTKLPLDDEAYAVRDIPPPAHTTSYLQGKSAPTTPGLLTHSPEHSRAPGDRRGSVPHNAVQLSKSKSASYLAASDLKLQSRRTIASGTTSPRRSRKADPEASHQDGDWLLRAGVLISAEARDYKGQMWLTSRASATSLAGMRDADLELFERELARERELALRNGSRRGSASDGFETGQRSARASRAGSRSISRVGSRTQILTPHEGRYSEEGYFVRFPEGDEYSQGPDFVNLDEKLEAIEQDTSQEDELAVRKLVRGERAGRGSWFGWPLFSVEEQEDSDVDGEDEADADVSPTLGRRSSSTLHFEGVTNAPKERIPPPDPQQGGWQDAAWLLTVASKVIL